jgi:hypothetical protein
VGAGRSAGRRWIRFVILRIVVFRIVGRWIKLGIVRRLGLFATASACAHGAAAADRTAS